MILSCVYCGTEDGPVVRECRCPKKKVICPDCYGLGVLETDYGFHTCVFRDTCKRCKGTGEVDETLHK